MDMITMLNTIRDNASQTYQDRIPEATRNNLSEIRGGLLDEVDMANEFMGMFMNKIAFTFVHSRLFKNPLAILKKGGKPTGDSVEEIFVNYAKAEKYDPTGANLLKRTLPDVKAIYHTMNRQDKYATTVSYEALAKAFTNYGTLENFVNGIINSLYNGSNLDEFILMKKMFDNAISTECAVKIEVADPVTSAVNATEFIKAVKLVSTNMQFPSTEYNGYLTAQDKDVVPVTTFTNLDEQYIIIDSATNVAIDVDVLASAFNMSKVEFLSKRIVIDSFPNRNIRAMLIDKNFVQMYDDMIKMTTFKNPEGLYDNYWLHVWQTISCSPLVNAVAFTVAEG